MFKHLQARHHIERLRMRLRIVFGRDRQILQLDFRLQGVQTRDRQGSIGQIDSHHRCPALSHRLGQNTASATHIQHPFAFEFGSLVNPVQAQWIYLMQWFEFAVWVPPTTGQLGKFFQLFQIDILIFTHDGLVLSQPLGIGNTYYT